jgi:hypothetical protein
MVCGYKVRLFLAYLLARVYGYKVRLFLAYLVAKVYGYKVRLFSVGIPYNHDLWL